MPTPDTILWTGISSLMLGMLSIIGWIVKTGFDGLRDQLKVIWERLESNRVKEEANAKAIAEIKAICAERHIERSGYDRRTRFDE